MCLITFCWQPGRPVPLVLAANRDEFHDRPTKPLGWWRWPDGPLAGRDGRSGGTWLAADREGRFAAVTNFREPGAATGPRSRGELPVSWLKSDLSAETCAGQIHDRRANYGPFTLLVGDLESLMIVGSHSPPEAVEPGIHALSNHVLDTPWPKSLNSCRMLEEWLAENGDAPLDGLLDLLDDRNPAPDDQLPETGVGREAERLLSAPFIVSPEYGTRSSSALVLGDTPRMAERSFDPTGRRIGEIRYSWPRRRTWGPSLGL